MAAKRVRLDSPETDNVNNQSSPEHLLSMQSVKGCEYQNSTESLLKLKPVQGCEASPECLFRSQPVPDGGDIKNSVADSDCQTSPECVFPSLPVRDPYSSDDCCIVDTTHEGKQTEKKYVMFPQLTQSCDLTAVEVLYLFDLDYTRQPTPLDLTGSTADDVVKTICTFAQPSQTHGMALHHKTLTKNPDLTWLSENDKLNFKTCSAEEKRELKNRFSAMKKSKRGQRLGDNTKHLVNYVEAVMTQYSKNRLSDPSGARSVVRILGQILPWDSFMRYASEVSYSVNYRVSEHLASDNTHIFTHGNRRLEIPVSPEAILEVDGQPHIGLQIGTVSSATKVSPRSKFVKLCDKPSQDKDAILSKDYRTAAEEYLNQFVCKDYGDSETMNAMLGQHMVELIGLSALRPCDPPLKQVLGMFMKNEYIYFSKLVMNNDKLRSYHPPVLPYERSTSEIGEISFGNWRMDLTLATHRMALISFLVNYLGAIS